MGKLLEDYVDAADQLSPEAFEDRYSPGFLVIHGEATSPRIRPVSVEFRNQPTFESARAVELNAMMLSEVYDLSTFAANRTVSIGRGLDVDLFIADPTVSRQHATLTWNRSGRVYLQHAGGRSPTLLNSQEAISEPDSALEVTSGSLIEVGNVALSYLNAREFQRLVWRLATEEKISGV